MESLWPYYVWYLLSISCSNIFCLLTRAVCGRIEQTIQGLPPPYRLNQPRMNQGSSTESRQPQKAPTISVNWDCGKSLAHFSLFVYVNTFEDINFAFCFCIILIFKFLILQIKFHEMSFFFLVLMGFLCSFCRRKSAWGPQCHDWPTGRGKQFPVVQKEILNKIYESYWTPSFHDRSRSRGSQAPLLWGS